MWREQATTDSSAHQAGLPGRAAFASLMMREGKRRLRILGAIVWPQVANLFRAEHDGRVNACGTDDSGKRRQQDCGEKDQCRPDQHGWVGAFDTEEKRLDIAD